LVDEGKVLPDYSDLRLVRSPVEGQWQEVFCAHFDAREVAFQLVDAVDPGVDLSYWVYYGNVNAKALPPPGADQCGSATSRGAAFVLGRMGLAGLLSWKDGPLYRTSWQTEEPLARFAPIVTIRAVYPHPAQQAVDTVSLRGAAVDDDELGRSIVAYEWHSDLDGLLSTQAADDIPASALSAGDHVISLRVLDDEGVWSYVLQRPLRILPAQAAERDWLFILYLAGDNNLHRSLQRTLIDLERMAPNENLDVVALLDGPSKSDTWRYHVQPGGQYVDGATRWRMGELDMDDPQTLTDLILWAQDNYPARYTYLAVADHGRGTMGMAWDRTSGSSVYLDVTELGQALRQASSGKRLDVVHYDACLMAMIENAYEIKDYARYWVASQNLSWGIFAYDDYARYVDEMTTPRQLAEAVVGEYDAQLSRYPHTIAAMDLSQAGEVQDAVSALAVALQASLTETSQDIDRARSSTQKFDSDDYYQLTEEDAYLDLYDLARMLQQNVQDVEVQRAAQSVMDAVETFVVAERSVSGVYRDYPRWDLESAHGVSIWFPQKPGDWDYAGYMSHVYRFTVEGQWDEFLDAYLGLIELSWALPQEPEFPPLMKRDWEVWIPAVVVR
jgi:hypothetical protein